VKVQGHMRHIADHQWMASSFAKLLGDVFVVKHIPLMSSYRLEIKNISPNDQQQALPTFTTLQCDVLLFSALFS